MRCCSVIGIAPVAPPNLARASCRQQAPAVVPRHPDIEDRARLRRHCQPNQREMLGAAHLLRLDQHAAARTHLAIEMALERLGALVTQSPRPLLDYIACDLRHARGWCARAWRERKDMQMRQ